MRKLGRSVRKRLRGALVSAADKLSAQPDEASDPKIAPPRHVAHGDWPGYLSKEFNRTDAEILEIGARVVTGANFRELFDQARYTGFDFYPGDNVDVVGDAHRLSSYFPEGTRFDLIFCSAVFEHLHMPWIVVEEIHKLLKLGGSAFVETHFSFSAHERPWNFFQFSDMGLRALFNGGMGFELVDLGMSNPIVGTFAPQAVDVLRGKPVRELYCHSEILVRKVREVQKFDWRLLNMDQIVDGTRYPSPPPQARSD